MVYVGCDACGDPCGGSEDMANDATEARALAKSMGWHRVPIGVHMADVCPRHDPKTAETRAAIGAWTGWAV